MLRAFGHPVATCYDMLGVTGSNLTIFKLEPITPNMSQHGGQTMLRQTLLQCVALACCDRLAGALRLVLKNRYINRVLCFPFFLQISPLGDLCLICEDSYIVLFMMNASFSTKKI